MKTQQKNIPDSTNPSQQVAQDKKSNISCSQHYQQYCQATKDVRLKYRDELQPIEKCMNSKNQNMNDGFKVNVNSNNVNKGKIVVTAYLSGIRLQIYVMLLDKNSPFSNYQQHQSGAFGKVYNIQLLDKHITVKTYPFSSQGLLQESIWSKEVQMAIKEFAFISLSGKFKCGPNCDLYFLPNILIFNNEIQLFMERCEPISSYSPHDYEDLLANLLHLHTLGIVHNDITPSNIMYSTIQNKLVFIDYGFSQILTEKIGQKTLTSFQGTAQYVSADMLKLFSIDDKKQYIDLYYNDLVALQTTNKYLQKHFDSLNKEDNQMETYNLKDKIMAIYEDQEDEFKNSEIKLFYLFVMLKLYIIENDSLPETFNKYKKAVYQKYGHEIIIILSKVMSQRTLKKYLFQQISDLSYLDSYQDLYKSMSLRTCRTKYVGTYIPFFLFPARWLDPKSQQYKLVIKQCKDSSPQAIRQFSKKELKKIEFYEQCSNNGVYITLLMNILRFDVNADNMKIKSSRAKNFIQFAKIDYQQQLTIKPEYSIQIAIKYSLNYYLTNICIPYGQEFTLHTLTQAIIINTDIRTELDQLLCLLKQYQYRKQQPIQYFISLLDGLFFVLKFLDMKYMYSNRNVLGEMKIKLSQCVDVLQQKIIDRCEESNKQQQKTIGMIFSLLKLRRCLEEEELELIGISIIKLNNQVIGEIIVKRILYENLRLLKTFVIDQIKQKWLFELKTRLSSIQWTNSWRFSELIYWRYNLALQEQDDIQLGSVQQFLYTSINCHTVASQFVCFFSYNNRYLFTTSQLVDKVKHFIDFCFEDNNLSQYRKQFNYLLFMISNDKSFQQTKVYFLTQITQKVITKFNREQPQITSDLQQKRIQRNCVLELIHTLYYCLHYYLIEQHQPRFLKLIISLEQLMHSLFWKLLEIKVKVGFWSEYQCYLVAQYYQFKRNKITNLPKQPYYLQFKQQLQLLTELPFVNRQQIIFKIFHNLSEGQLKFYNSKLQVSYPQQIQYAIFLSKIASWVLKYCSYQNEYYYFFRHSRLKNYLTIYTMLVYLKTSGQQQNKEILFLEKVILTLSMFPSNQNIGFFEKNICKFYSEFPTLQIMQMILKKDLVWKQRFFLFLYALALGAKRSVSKQRRYLSMIARHIYMHTWVSKQPILYLYYKNILSLNSLNTSNLRKRRYVIRHYYGIFEPKQGAFYSYNQKQSNKEMLTLCGLKKKNINYFKRIFKEKVEK